ncbi:hypothetical protein B0H66DRAFT_602501 [Apodospora peruviana]|uniref:Carrier domain-containing protein n=1 Tax=Apodospora peruviana TaxID=516989 RepID=A0AAE0M948_9PEZI|nr:hypothetical protein B0H66DRAFT_602501 [Apodospora peruviana]
MYMTGDLCRYGASGEMIFMGREDFQVKHHEQRVELGRRPPSQAGRLSGRLVAVLYLELDSITSSASSSTLNRKSTNPTQLQVLSHPVEMGLAHVHMSAIRSRVVASLPDFMVPAVWVAVQALPLTPNHKLDRATRNNWLEHIPNHVYESILGGGEEEEDGVDGGGVAVGTPATSRQKQLHDLLSSTLKLARINMNRSFLDLGGDSIVAMKLRAKARSVGISLTVPDILTCASISQLAARAEKLGGGHDSVVGRLFPLTGWQRRVCFGSGSMSPQMTVAVLDLSTPTTITAPKLLDAVEEIVQQHPMLRARVITNEPATSYYRFTAHFFATRTDVVRFLSTIDNTHHVNVESGEPLLAVHLLETAIAATAAAPAATCNQPLAMAVHPLIADVTSVYIIMQDLERILQGGLLSSSDAGSFSLPCSILTDIGTVDEADGDSGAGDYDDDDNMVEKAIIVDAPTTSLLLSEANSALSTQPMDILIDCLAYAWTTVFGHPPTAAVHRES